MKNIQPSIYIDLEDEFESFAETLQIIQKYFIARR